MRCKLCCRFYERCGYLSTRDNQLAAIYDANFKAEPTSLRAFIVRSHGARHSRLTQWLITELQDFKCRKHSDLTYDVGSQARMADSPIVVRSHTGADVNAVATYTQEHLPL